MKKEYFFPLSFAISMYFVVICWTITIVWTPIQIKYNYFLTLIWLIMVLYYYLFHYRFFKKVTLFENDDPISYPIDPNIIGYPNRLS